MNNTRLTGKRIKIVQKTFIKSSSQYLTSQIWCINGEIGFVHIDIQHGGKEITHIGKTKTIY